MRNLLWTGICSPWLLLSAPLEGTEMPVDAIPLWKGKPPQSRVKEGFRPWLECYLVQTEEQRGAVLVCPGGGYGGRADHEARPVAEAFRSRGCHGFVLHYRVSPHRHPEPLMDAARAVQIIRHRAKEWKVNKDKIAVLGFSAGGHLAASLGVHYERAPVGKKDAINKESCRPDALVLCYPVITSGKYRHEGSLKNLLGEQDSEAMREVLSLEKHVTDKTPPTFLWHTSDDQGVPVQNSLLFAESLFSSSVPSELHIYPTGRHGLGLAPEDPHIASWVDLAAQWLYGMGW